MAATLVEGQHQSYQQHQQEERTEDSLSLRESVNAMVKEYLDWAGLSESARVLQHECEQHGVILKPLSRPLSSSSKDILNHFDSGHGAQFFQRWDAILSGLPARNTLEVTKLEFYLHVYFSSLPLRHGHKEDHIAAMAVFRRFLETCSPRVGSCPDLLAYYALPYVPDPLNHPTFTKVFQDAWLEEVRTRLCAFLQEHVDIKTQRPRLLALFAQKHDHAINESCAAVVRAHERLAETQRIYKTLKRKFHKLQDDYNKLIGVSSELTQALEAAVRGERIDVETTLASCTHLFPELFQFVFSADVGAPPASILRESMDRYRRGPQSCTSPLTPIDFRRVRQDLCHAPVYEQILLLQALRWRLTHTSKGSGRQASVTAYARGDVLGLLQQTAPSSSPQGSSSPSPWAKFKEVVAASEPQPLAQACCRFINALASFAAGRNYLASRMDVIDALTSGLLSRPSDPVTADMILATVQKLSIRRDVQLHLISNGMVEWLVGLLRESHQELSAYSLEYATALLMNLSMRSDGKERCLPHAKSINKLLADLLATNNSQVVPYVNGTLYSLMMHPRLRQEAANMGLDQVLQYYAQSGGAELRRQLEYIIRQVRQENLTSPPPSPVDDPRDHEEDPETLEEELDAEDPVRPRPTDMTGEELLAWRYSLHPAGGEMMFRPSQAPQPQYKEQEQEQEQGPRSYRSAPLAPQSRREYVNCPRPRTDGGGGGGGGALYNVSSPPYTSQGSLKVPPGQWDYPSDNEMSQRAEPAQPRIRPITPYNGLTYDTLTSGNDYSGSDSDTPGGGGGTRREGPGGEDEGERDKGNCGGPPSTRASRCGSSTEVGGGRGAAGSRASRSSSRSKRWGPPKALGSAKEDARSGGGEEGGGDGGSLPQLEAANAPPAHNNVPLTSASSSGRKSPGTSQQPRSRTATLRKAPTPMADRPPNTAHPPGSQASHREPERSSRLADATSSSKADEEASQIVSDVLGESRNLTTASKAPKPEDDPLFRSLPPPKASEYVVAFSSRPRILRTPPPPDASFSASQSRVQAEEYEVYEFDGRRVRHGVIPAGDAPASPRSVLPPISKTNHSFTRTAT